MLAFISLLGGVVIYELFGNVSGLDAIGLAGIISGFSIGVFSGKSFGMYSLFPSFLSGFCVSLLLVIIAIASANTGEPVMIVLGQFAVGFSLLSGSVLGCKWGDHLVVRESDLAQLRRVFGERPRSELKSRRDFAKVKSKKQEE